MVRLTPVVLPLPGRSNQLLEIPTVRLLVWDCKTHPRYEVGHDKLSAVAPVNLNLIFAGVASPVETSRLPEPLIKVGEVVAL